MTYPTLPVPSSAAMPPGNDLEEEVRVKEAQFGSNHAQRSADGFNTITGKLSLTLEVLHRSETSVLVDFLRGQGGYKAFYFTPPGETESRLWTCKKWRVSHDKPTHDSLTMEMEQAFAPDVSSAL